MEQFLTILLSAGGATVLAAAINAVMNRRKLSAEATEIITKAAAGTVENVMKDNTWLRQKIVDLESRIVQFELAEELHETREREHLRAEDRYAWHMQQCHDYTERLASALRAMGGRVDDPPPIWPPIHRD
jgi:LPS O-antigen subunit length determinant protein (WzzB/FepE family)